MTMNTTAIVMFASLLLGANISSAAAAAGHSVPLAKNGAPAAVIAIPDKPDAFMQHLGGELQSWLQQLSGARLEICQASALPANMPFISVGGAGLKSLRPDTSKLKPEGFVLKTAVDDGRACVVCVGRDDAGTMYAVYELLERLGIVFQMVKTIVPETRRNLEAPPLDIAQSPEIKNRGYGICMITAPWIGFEEFRNHVDQMARMKLNYVMLWNGVSSPSFDFEVRGEKNLLGDQMAKESGYLAWRCSTGRHTPADMTIGRERFAGPRACAAEFQRVETPEEAKTVARDLQQRMIDYAHSRKVRVALGISDLPCIPINFARHRVHPMNATPWYGAQPSPSEPIVEEVWRAMLDNVLTTYPQADGVWIWISEAHRQYKDEGYQRMAADVRAKYGHLVRTFAEIKEAAMWRPTTDAELDADFAYLHLAKRMVEETKARHPQRNIGIAWCGRLYLFRAMDAIFAKDVPLLSLEACICWCREKRVPMEWGELPGRETWLMPRLDDDVNTFGPQWNVELFSHDRVLDGSKKFGFSGILAQVPSRFRGLEHNADFLARGYWNTELAQEPFYRDYARRVFGAPAGEPVFRGFMELEKYETFLGRDARVPHGGISYFSGLMNFVMYFDSPEIRAMGMFRDQKLPFEGPRFAGNWDVGRYEKETMVIAKTGMTPQPTDPTRKTGNSGALDLTAFEGYDHLHGGPDGKFIENCIYRKERFQKALPMLRAGRAHFASARQSVLPGAREELDYMIYKLDMFERHITWLCRVLETWLAMDRAFALRAKGDSALMRAAFDEMLSRYDEGLNVLRGTVRQMAASLHTSDSSERHILFRYHVRFLNPAEAFRTFISNLRNFHLGVAPYWEPVDWERIRITQWMDM
jgi:hypothetical protein